MPTPLDSRLLIGVGTVNRLCTLLAALLLGACGGGGGGGGGGGFTGPSLSLSTASLPFAADRGAPPPAQQSIEIIVGGPVTQVAYSIPGTPPDWLAIDGVWTSDKNLKVTFVITDTDLPGGTYSALINFHGRDAGLNILITKPVQVTLTVEEPVSFGASAVNAPDATFGHSSHTATVGVPVTANGERWQVSTTAPWITLPSGVQEGSATLSVMVDSAGLAPGDYQATLQIVNVDEPAETDEVVVGLTVRYPEVTAPPSSFPFFVIGGVNGREASPRDFAFSLDTGTNQYPWSITNVAYGAFTPAEWLTFSKTSGMAGASGDVFATDAARDLLPPGVYEATFTLSFQVLDEVVTATVPVRLNFEENLIYAVQNGVALHALPSRSLLAGQVSVHTSWDQTDVAWTAESDQPWLSVTPAGLTGGALSLQADPTGLAADGVHVATVTIAAEGFDNEETVTVALWKGSTDPGDVTISTAFADTAANPVLPYVHVSDDDELRTYNVYTGALVSTLPSPYAQSGDLAISSDGLTLYVGNAAHSQISGVDVASGDVVSTALRGLGRLAYLRVKGHPILTSSTQGTGFLSSPLFAATRDGRTLFAGVNFPDDTFQYGGVTLDYSALASPPLTVTSISLPQVPPESGQTGALAMVDAERILLAITSADECRLHDSPQREQLWAVPALGTPNNTLARSDGLLLCGSNVAAEGPDIQLLDLDGNALGTLSSPTGALLDDEMAIASDPSRLVVPTDAGVIGILEIPD